MFQDSRSDHFQGIAYNFPCTKYKPYLKLQKNVHTLVTILKQIDYNVFLIVLQNHANVKGQKGFDIIEQTCTGEPCFIWSTRFPLNKFSLSKSLSSLDPKDQ